MYTLAPFTKNDIRNSIKTFKTFDNVKEWVENNKEFLSGLRFIIEKTN